MKFQSKSFARISIAALCAATIGSAVAAPIASAQAPSASQATGTVVSSEPLPKDLWIPGTADAKRFTYWTIGSNAGPALSSGAYYVPAGPAPEGGWPVIAWAHGTTGLDDSCAPSLVGPGLPERDYPYLGRWLSEGYAVVATDYVGLGTPGLMPYLDGKVEAHSVVDSVKAARVIDSSISNRWAVVGQSQGGGAAITTARYATEYGGDSLDYRGGVGTGVPANIELTLLPAGPGFPPIALGGGLTSYALYILAGLREAHPEIDLNSYLNDLGREKVDSAEKLCAADLDEASKDLVLGDIFSRPLSQIPNFQGLLNDYMGVPTSGYDRPIFIGQGLLDVDVPAPSALSLVAALVANGEPVTFKTYNTDHSGALVESQADTIPFVANLFR
ncbi:lipase family protein [Rhodococcus erythropolis]|uniref:Lipase family protein n=1 Tax=Rhodococcus erythropolis TaxID=1833 RepID=A0AAX3V3B0_RHOER|nr:lipase family protein [Rhodococcus erythropolis]MDJ0404273.1 lipase family protein [Rhodococcus erythropolis]WGV49006.2 lipase family protein [Rhodococcus erythropolis]